MFNLEFTWKAYVQREAYGIVQIYGLRSGVKDIGEGVISQQALVAGLV
ncbi:MAG: hypothetical protein K5905_21685 [Roseibium sp.]|nr:hypothetical protein [Roseibium sp.]MCV0428076.1 hypothetical protein [Roseibium sp.]